MTLRNMPMPVVEILFEELRNIERCDGCGEIKICETRDDYIAEQIGDETSRLYYLPYSDRFGFVKGTDEYVTTKVEHICYDCLDFFNDDWIKDFEKWQKKMI